MERDITVMSYDDAVKKLTEEYSCFEKVTAIQHIAIHPKFIQKLRTGVKTYLDTQLRLYSNKLKGIVVAYSNIKRVKEYGAIVDEQAHLHYDIQADYIVFKPKIGSILKGMVNKNGQDHLGLLVHNCFNVSIPKPRDAVNGWEGSCLALLDEVLLEVTSLMTSHRGIISIKGKLKDARLTQNTNAARKRDQALSLVTTVKSEYSPIDGTDGDLPDIKPPVVGNHNNTMDNKDSQSAKKSKKAKKRKRDSENDTDYSSLQESSDSNTNKRKKKNSVETVTNIKIEPVEEETNSSLDVSLNNSKKKKKSKKHKKDKSIKQEVVDPDFLNSTANDTSSLTIDTTIDTTPSRKHKKKKKIKEELDKSFIVPDQSFSMDNSTLDSSSSRKSKKKRKKDKKNKESVSESDSNSQSSSKK